MSRTIHSAASRRMRRCPVIVAVAMTAVVCFGFAPPSSRGVDAIGAPVVTGTTDASSPAVSPRGDALAVTTDSTSWS